MEISTIGSESYCLSELKNVDVGNYTSIAGGCVFHSNDNHAWVQHKTLVSTYPFSEKWNITSYPQSSGKGHVSIGSDCWIGEGCRFMSGVHVGNGAIVAAGSVVSKDVPDFAVVAGNPARIKYFRFDQDTREKLLQIAWWNRDKGGVVEHIESFMDINRFVKEFG